VVSGPFGNIGVHPDATGVAEKIGGFLLGAVNPAAMLLPLIKTGTLDKNPCVRRLEEVTQP
jgi:hypothetical protein